MKWLNEDKLKMWLCDGDSVLGKVAHILAKVGMTTKVEVDVRDFDVFETYCWCCCLWRGVLLGLLVGVAVGAVLL